MRTVAQVMHMQGSADVQYDAAKNGRWVIAVTGASGACYALRLIGELAGRLESLDIVVSDAGLRVLHDEEGFRASFGSLREELLDRVGASDEKVRDRVVLHHPNDIGASIASGSVPRCGMVIVPCSMGSLGAIAHGVAQNLIHRAAEVTMKERRKLIIVPRETPLTAIHLENMLALARLGVSIVPAMPGFYTRPSSVTELIDMQTMKVLDLMGIPNDAAKRWKDVPVTGENSWAR